MPHNACFICTKSLPTKYRLHREMKASTLDRHAAACVHCGFDQMHAECLIENKFQYGRLYCPLCSFGLQEGECPPILCRLTSPSEATKVARKVAEKAVAQHQRLYAPAVRELAREFESTSQTSGLPLAEIQEIMAGLSGKVLATAERLMVPSMYPPVRLSRDREACAWTGWVDGIAQFENLPSALFGALADAFWDEVRSKREERLLALNASTCEEQLAMFKKAVDSQARGKAIVYVDCKDQFPFAEGKEYRVAELYKRFYMNRWVDCALDKVHQRSRLSVGDRSMLERMYQPLGAQLLREMSRAYDEAAREEMEDLRWA